MLSLESILNNILTNKEKYCLDEKTETDCKNILKQITK